MAEEKQELSSEELTLKEVFLVFDKHSSGTVAAEHLGMALRSCGKRLTEANVADLRKKCEDEKGGKLNFEDFKEYVELAADVEKTPEDIERAFKVFEKESEKTHGQAGTVDLKVLRQALTTLGDKLTPQEMEFFVNAAGNKSSIDFASFMELVQSK